MKTSPILTLPLVIAVILIVYGRVNHRSRWGNWIALAGYATLAISIIAAILTRGRAR
ncbi:MAG: hypothetical protein ACP5VP_00945 [Candidatus Limnocylindrales bacterium]